MQITKLFSILIISSFILASCSNDDDTPILSNQSANKRPLGTSSNDLLSDTIYKRLTIEMVSVQGFEPTITAINTFKSFLENRLFKPDGIIINQRSIASSKLSPFSIEEVKQIEDINRQRFNKEGEITVYIYFADGGNENDSNTNITLGTAYLNTSIVIYQGTLRKLASNPNAPLLSSIEGATLIHEFAHLLGLVNIGTPLQSEHEDSNSKGHCNIQGCLMEAAIEFGSGMMDILGNGIPKLDPQCLADLKANGGR